MPQFGGPARDRHRAPILIRKPKVIREHDRGGERHRRRAGGARRPLGLEPERPRPELAELRAVAEVRALEHETQRALPVAEDQKRGDEDDQVQVEAAERRAAFLDRTQGRALRDAEMDDPRGKPDDEERDRETRLLAVLRCRSTELVEDEREPRKPARWRAERELGTDAQKVRDSQNDHVNGDERDQIEVGALHGGERAVDGVHERR